MNIVLWIIQTLLAVMMLVIGFMKTFLPVKKLQKFSWTTRNSIAFIRFVGVSELLIGAGLILPWLTGIFALLTSLAAVGVCIIMLLAIAEHIKHHEKNDIWKNVVILLLSGFVAVERFVQIQ